MRGGVQQQFATQSPPRPFARSRSAVAAAIFMAPETQETTKNLKVEGSRSDQSSRGTKAPRTLVLLCFGAIREGRMIRDRSLLTS